MLKTSIFNTINQQYKELNTYYRPNFTFKQSLTSTTGYLKAIYDQIASSQQMRFINLQPTILNSCCLEKLDENTDYYTYFKIKLPSIKQTVPEYKFCKYVDRIAYEIKPIKQKTIKQTIYQDINYIEPILKKDVNFGLKHLI